MPSISCYVCLASFYRSDISYGRRVCSGSYCPSNHSHSPRKNYDVTIKKFDKNTEGRDFFVGDLHGCVELLEGELARIEFDYEKDRLFSVGDLVDRGPDNVGTLKLLTEPWFHAVIGNHEVMMVEHFQGAQTNWQHSYGKWINEEDYDPGEVFSLIALAEDLPLGIEVDTDIGKIGIVHAEVPGLDWSRVANAVWTELTWGIKNDFDLSIWCRDVVLNGTTVPVDGIDVVIHGHTPMKPHARGNRVYIDVGTFHTKVCRVFSVAELKSLLDNQTGGDLYNMNKIR